MRIPDDATLPFPSKRDRSAKDRGTRPVSGSPSLANEFPERFPRPRQTLTAPPERDESAARSEREGGNDAQPERRHEDRRHHNVPVTLDTRLTRPRRKPASPEINIEI